jgi:hypothetical protein
VRTPSINNARDDRLFKGSRFEEKAQESAITL